MHKKAQKKYHYKVLSEKEVNDSYHIPKVNYKDFDRHLQNIGTNSNEYVKHQEDSEKKRLSHLAQEQGANYNSENPFEVAATVNSGRGSGRKSFQVDADVVPPEFYSEDYRIDRAWVRMTQQEDISILSSQLQKHLDLIDHDLEKSISKNFDFFNKAFNHFDHMKDDMKVVSDKTKVIADANRKLKYYQLKNMIWVYRLQRKKLNIAKASEVLKYVTVLQQSIPVIDNLI